MTYHQPLAYLLGLEGVALQPAWAADYDEDFVQARIAEIRRLLDDPLLADHPGVQVATGTTQLGYISEVHSSLILTGSLVQAGGPDGEPGIVPTFRHSTGTSAGQHWRQG